jgi:arylsulfatase A-like enzyme
LDSHSFLTALYEPEKRLPRPPMIHRLNALRVDDWKWIHPGRTTPFEKTIPEEYELYDLKTDPGEQSDIAEKNEKRSEEFFKIYQAFNQNRKLK